MATDGTPGIDSTLGARKMARELQAEALELRRERDEARAQLARLGALSVLQLEARKAELRERDRQRHRRSENERIEASKALNVLQSQLADCRKTIVETEIWRYFSRRGFISTSSSDGCRRVQGRRSTSCRGIKAMTSNT